MRPRKEVPWAMGMTASEASPYHADSTNNSTANTITRLQRNTGYYAESSTHMWRGETMGLVSVAQCDMIKHICLQ
jgi:hypothetical protein